MTFNLNSVETLDRMNESGPSGREAPLPPVTTRWASPAAAPETYVPALAPPFVPGAPMVQPNVAMPVLRAFDSAPLEEVSLEDEVAYGAAVNEGFDGGDALTHEIPLEMIPVHEAYVEETPVAANPVSPASPVPVIPVQQGRQPGEPLMPWEETLPDGNGTGAHATHTEPGPVVTAESETTPARDLDDWETAIDSEGGEAMPAYGDEATPDDAFAPAPQLDEEGTLMQQPERADQSFPMDAFIIPPDAKRLPKGLEHAEELHLEIAEQLAKRLEAVAQRLRREGFAGLLQHNPEQEPIDTLLAGVLAGYLSNQTDA